MLSLLMILLWAGVSWASTGAPTPTIFSGGTGSAASHYASPTGSGSTCSSASPCSLTTCISQTFAGESCILKNGTYSETGPIVTVRDGTSGNHIVIKAENSRQAVVQTNNTDRAIRIKHNYITVSGIYIDSQHKGHGIGNDFNGGQNHIIIEDCTVYQAGRAGIRINDKGDLGSDHIIIRNNFVNGSGYEDGQTVTEGMYIGEASGVNGNVHDVFIYGNQVRDFASNCLDSKNTNKDLWYFQNICYEDVDPSVHGVGDPVAARDFIIGLQGSGNYAYNNFIHDIDDDGDIFDIRKSTDSTPNLAYNNVICCSPNVTKAIEARPGNSGAIGKVFNNTFYSLGGYAINETDHTLTIVNNIGLTRTNNLAPPASNYFTNAANADFHLTSLATNAIDQASGEPFSLLDYDGSAINNGTRDYGAFESGGVFVEPPDIAVGLIAHWTGNNTLADSAGSHTLTYGGGSAAYETGQIGNAFSFDGTTYATPGVHTIDGVSLFPTSGGQNWSVALWFKTSFRGTPLSSAQATAAERDFQIAVGTGGNTSIYLRGEITSDGASTDNDNNWHHIAVTWDGSDAAYYVDNVLITASATVGTSTEDTGENIIIGARTGGTGFPLEPGAVDDVRIYNIAIGASVVDALYNLTLDTESPTAPTNLSIDTVLPTQFDISWTASTDDNGPILYHIETCDGASCSDFAEVAQTANTTYSITDLSELTLYRVRVRAEDGAANFSTYSSIAEDTTTSSSSGLEAHAVGGSFSGGSFK